MNFVRSLLRIGACGGELRRSILVFAGVLRRELPRPLLALADV